MSKAPKSSVSGKVIHTLVNKKSGALLGAALSARVTPSLLSRYGVTLPVVGDSRTAVLLGSAGVGLACGYVASSLLDAIRWSIVRRLLRYQRWIYKPKAKSTTFWGILLKIFIGPPPYDTLQFQKALPSLPLPSLDETLDKYLKVVEPILDEEEFKNTKALVERFRIEDGPILQKYLKKKQKKSRNWLADWWLEYAYLANRFSIAINVNFYMTSGLESTHNPIARASLAGVAALRYNEMMQKKELHPDLIMETIPVCMDGIRFIFSACRIPGIETDTLELYPESEHIIVMRKGVYFKVNVYPTDKSGRKRLVNSHELQQLFEHVFRETENVTEYNKVAALTAQKRSEWAKHRDLLKKNPINSESLKDIESAIFILVFGHEKPENLNEGAKIALAGNGYSRWFDKGICLELFEKSSHGGANMEHTGADATHYAIMWEDCLQGEKTYDKDGNLPPYSGEILTMLPPPKLEWDLYSMQDIIEAAYKEYRAKIDELEVCVVHGRIEKNWIKNKKVSPDGFLQMAMQLTYYRIHNKFTKTYEPASTRLFYLGRTENINPVSLQSVRFCTTFDDSSVSSRDKIAAMREAIDEQSRCRLEATLGYGTDRHMLGLRLAAVESGRQVPPLFTDKAYELPMNMSTSQVPTNVGRYGIPLSMESIGGGFGPSSDEGYGILYCGVGDSLYNFHITSWKTSGKTSACKFGETLSKTLEDMKLIFDEI